MKQGGIRNFRHEKTHDETRRILVRSHAPGTCGEFMQGHIKGQDFLVNCPIDLYSCAEVTPCENSGLKIELQSQYCKVRDTLTLASHELMLPLRHAVSIRSKIPRGKGMASSSADTSATLSAFLEASACSVSPLIFARLLAEVDPSDGVHFTGITRVNHLTGDMLDHLPEPSGMRVLIVDCGGTVDTLNFDREHARAVYRKNEERITSALLTLKRGLREDDPIAIAYAATESARISQDIHYKPQFDDLLRLVTDLGALGVNCAHSGSVLGVLYLADAKLAERLCDAVTRRFGSFVGIVGDHRIISGGCDVQLQRAKDI